jgi:isopenicillin-N epimerase
MAEYHWDEVRSASHKLLNQAVERVSALVNRKPPVPTCMQYCPQMGIAHLPKDVDLAVLKSRLYDQYNIEVPLILWGESKFIRISVQGYNTQEDIDALVDALTDLL